MSQNKIRVESSGKNVARCGPAAESFLLLIVHLIGREKEKLHKAAALSIMSNGGQLKANYYRLSKH